MAKTGRFALPDAIHYEIDSSQVEHSQDVVRQNLPFILDKVSKRTAVLARNILGQIFDETMENLSYDAFAPEFREGIRRNVAKMGIRVDASLQRAAVSINFDDLGNRNDLRKAFHRHAVLSGQRGLLDSPFTGQELEVKDTADRHAFFEAMLAGEAFTAKDGRVIQTAGLWQQTKLDYLAIWGDKSPQWLYLQFGQTLWDPKIKPGKIIEQFTEVFDGVADNVFAEEIDAIVKIRDPGVPRTPTGIPHSPREGITIRNKTYRYPQFTPRS